MSNAGSSAEIERDAEHERAELVSTLDQLRENLKPANVIDEVMASAKITTTDITDRVWRTARANPIPATLIGLGAAMILGVGQKVRSSAAAKDHDWTSGRRFPQDGSTAYVRGEQSGAQRARSTASSLQANISSQLDRVGQQASQAASKIAESASDFQQQASRQLTRYASSARNGLSSSSRDGVMNKSNRSHNQTNGRLSRFIDEQPLVLAALGIAVGAAIGAAIPTSDTESEWMGDASGSVKQAARDLAREQYSQIRDTAGQTIEEVKRSVAEHGVSTENLSDLVRDVGDKVQAGATQVGGKIADNTKTQNS